MPCSGAPPPPPPLTPQSRGRQLAFDDLLLPGGNGAAGTAGRPCGRFHRFRRGYVAWLLLRGASRREIRARTGHDMDTIAADCRAVAELLETMMRRRGYAVREAFPDEEQEEAAPLPL